jgi:hypothetical protein
MEANNILFRCSSLGYLMTDSRSKSEPISETTKTHLIDVFVSAKYGRKEFIEGKFLDKGNEREEDSITLLSRINKKFYKKNSEKLSNEFVRGELDIFLGEMVNKADETIDTKTSWSAHTYHRAKNKPLDKMYEWQGHGYMWLSGAKRHTVAYCLVNGTADAIMAEKRKASFRFGIDADVYPEYIEKCKQIEINHIFDMQSFIMENPHFQLHTPLSDWNHDIPMNERLHTFTFERDEAKLELLKNRIIECRNWMQKNLFNA